MLYDEFKPIVDLVLNNWTALQLAVEHGMGAPGGEKTAQLMSVYIARYCVENVVDRDELTEVIEDLMDEEFETVCHDDSPKEIAVLLLQFLNLLKEGRHDECRARLDAMPKCQIWLSQPIHESVPPQCHGNPDDDSTSSSGDDEGDESPYLNGTSNPPATSSNTSNAGPEPMDEDVDPGWTVTAQLMSVYIARYCVENVVDRDELTEVIEDLMDEEFETVCHDDSPKEIAVLLLQFLNLLKEGRHDECRARLDAMPKCQIWLSQPIHESVPPQCHGNPDDDSTSSSGDDEGDESPYLNGTSNPPATSSNTSNAGPEPMDEDVDPGWTVVRSRRKH
uniref:Pre-rRNA-processing protein TSR2 homolog n=1 Tax=Heliothis virescens TaxID=7102 RepID=A0A2A4K2H8_HELVI